VTYRVPGGVNDVGHRGWQYSVPPHNYCTSCRQTLQATPEQQPAAYPLQYSKAIEIPSLTCAVILCAGCSTLSFGGSKVRLHLEVYANKDQRPVLRESHSLAPPSPHRNCAEMFDIVWQC
jgi:hypothetical protein